MKLIKFVFRKISMKVSFKIGNTISVSFLKRPLNLKIPHKRESNNLTMVHKQVMNININK